jgi:hypothetical protein
MMPSMGRTTVIIAPVLTLCAAILWYFHNRFWWPVDEGVYAYVAQRLLAGDVLHRDLIDLHGGYVNLLHALALKLFGEDLLSLRYPLVLLTLVQSALAAALLRPQGLWLAALAALGATAFSFIQFLNPSANWYALFIALLTCWVLTRVDAARLAHATLIGALLGLCFLFRQLSGIFLAMGVLTWLLATMPAGDRPPRLARALLAIMALGLAGYLLSKGSVVGLILFGIWPFALLLLAIRSVRADDKAVARLLLGLAIGVILAFAPLAIHHGLEGSFSAWLNDILFAALLIHGQDFIGRSSFALVLIGALQGLTDWRDPGAMLNGVLWLTLLLATPLLGWTVVGAALRGNWDKARHPLPIVAVFFALVAVHFQIPIYLWFAITPVLLALLWCGGRNHLRIASVAVVLLASIAVYFQAGQPLSRGLGGIVRGERVALDAPEGLPRASLAIEQTDQQAYGALLKRIELEARPGEPLFTLPMDPEINFLTGRPTPMPYYGTPLGLRQATDVADSVRRLTQAAPLFVVYRRNDKYLTPLSEELLREVRRRDPAPETFGPFELYRVPAPPAPGATSFAPG